MSAAVNTEDTTNTLMFCASCGTAGGDDVKLKNCTACYLVKYCSVNCQRQHRPQHKKECKKRAAELKDQLLFRQPECTHRGDCPICLLPIPIATSKETVRSTLYQCCSKYVCDGCAHANNLRETQERLPKSCPFCRHPLPRSVEESLLHQKKRVKANDPAALQREGMDHTLAGKYVTAIKYFEKAAGLGDIEAHFNLSDIYYRGRGVEKDMKKFIYHLEEAAIGGHVVARDNLGAVESQKGNLKRVLKHYIIAAKLGFEESMEHLKKYYECGALSKEDFAAVLTAHRAAVDAMKSPQRDAAEAAKKRGAAHIVQSGFTTASG